MRARTGIVAVALLLALCCAASATAPKKPAASKGKIVKFNQLPKATQALIVKGAQGGKVITILQVRNKEGFNYIADVDKGQWIRHVVVSSAGNVIMQDDRKPSTSKKAGNAKNKKPNAKQ